MAIGAAITSTAPALAPITAAIFTSPIPTPRVMRTSSISTPAITNPENADDMTFQSAVATTLIHTDPRATASNRFGKRCSYTSTTAAADNTEPTATMPHRTDGGAATVVLSATDVAHAAIAAPRATGRASAHADATRRDVDTGCTPNETTVLTLSPGPPRRDETERVRKYDPKRCDVDPRHWWAW